MNKETRLFFVVDSFEANEEIFTTAGKAREFADELRNQGDSLVGVRVCFVNNAYYDNDIKSWMYDDYSDTFVTIIETT